MTKAARFVQVLILSLILSSCVGGTDTVEESKKRETVVSLSYLTDFPKQEEEEIRVTMSSNAVSASQLKARAKIALDSATTARNQYLMLTNSKLILVDLAVDISIKQITDSASALDEISEEFLQLSRGTEFSRLGFLAEVYRKDAKTMRVKAQEYLKTMKSIEIPVINSGKKKFLVKQALAERTKNRIIHANDTAQHLLEIANRQGAKLSDIANDSIAAKDAKERRKYINELEGFIGELSEINDSGGANLSEILAPYKEILDRMK